LRLASAAWEPVDTAAAKLRAASATAVLDILRRQMTVVGWFKPIIASLLGRGTADDSQSPSSWRDEVGNHGMVSVHPDARAH
jgi:hypothetical protein